ncbi:MAG: energy transducer TonB [Bacteroidetes bacterium]|nr:energy transducer TonB [Bacteroidota bacterium]
MPKLYQYVVLLIFISKLGYSQELQMVEEHPSDNVMIQYHVVAAQPKIRQGIYQKFLTVSLKLVEEGYYKNGLKDSLWTYFNILGDTTEKGYYSHGLKNGYWKNWLFSGGKPIIIREGNYGEGKRIGLWTFRNTDGSLDNKYDFDSGKVIEYGKTDKFITLIDKTDTITTIMDRPPIHIGGLDTLYDVLARNITIPMEIKRNMSKQFHYKAFVSFCINENGTLENYSIVRGNNRACNDEALRVIKLWDDGKWVAGYYNGHAVKVMQIIPIVFDTTIIDYGTQTILNANGFH